MKDGLQSFPATDLAKLFVPFFYVMNAIKSKKIPCEVDNIFREEYNFFVEKIQSIN